MVVTDIFWTDKENKSTVVLMHCSATSVKSLQTQCTIVFACLYSLHVLLKLCIMKPVMKDHPSDWWSLFFGHIFFEKLNEWVSEPWPLLMQLPALGLVSEETVFALFSTTLSIALSLLFPYLLLLSLFFLTFLMKCLLNCLSLALFLSLCLSLSLSLFRFGLSVYCPCVCLAAELAWFNCDCTLVCVFCLPLCSPSINTPSTHLAFSSFPHSMSPSNTPFTTSQQYR